MNFMIVPSENCPASCSYCFGPHTDGSIIDDETTKLAVSWFGKYSTECKERPSKIIVHGGEPLTAGMGFYESLFSNAKELFNSVQFTIQSNLWLLDADMAELLAKNRVHIGTSLDGPRSVCDQQRGDGYFERTMKGVGLANSVGLHVGYICTFTRKSAEMWKEVFDYFANMRSGLNIHPCVADLGGNADESLVIPEEDFTVIMHNLLDRYTSAMSHGVNIRISTFDNYFKGALYRQPSGCLFGKCLGRFVSVGPDGKIYPCNRFVGTDLSIGSVFDMPTRADLTKSDAWKLIEERDNTVEAECDGCSHFSYCNGGCPYEALAAGKGEFVSKRDPYCGTHRSLFDRLSSCASHWPLFRKFLSGNGQCQA